MGGGAWTSSNWKSYAKSNNVNTGASASQLYSHTTSSKWLPFNVIREACDSVEHPDSTPIILGLDVTGSMSNILKIVAVKLGNVMEEIYSRKPVSDPQVLFAAIDDIVSSYNECIQVTQFESDIRIAEQMKELNFIERGAGNDQESYALAWYFAARHTKCDAIKRGKKGIIITIGDDGLQSMVTRSEVKEVFGDVIEKDITISELLSELQRDWEVFHITMTNRGRKYDEDRVLQSFNILGDHSISCDNVEYLPEVIVSLLESVAGKSINQIVDSWDGSTAVAVRNALSSLATKASTDSGLVEF